MSIFKDPDISAAMKAKGIDKKKFPSLSDVGIRMPEVIPKDKELLEQMKEIFSVPNISAAVSTFSEIGMHSRDACTSEVMGAYFKTASQAERVEILKQFMLSPAFEKLMLDPEERQRAEKTRSNPDMMPPVPADTLMRQGKYDELFSKLISENQIRKTFEKDSVNIISAHVLTNSLLLPVITLALLEERNEKMGIKPSKEEIERYKAMALKQLSSPKLPKAEDQKSSAIRSVTLMCRDEFVLLASQASEQISAEFRKQHELQREKKKSAVPAQEEKLDDILAKLSKAKQELESSSSVDSRNSSVSNQPELNDKKDNKGPLIIAFEHDKFKTEKPSTPEPGTPARAASPPRLK